MAYQRKTRDECDLLGNYGDGWDRLVTEDSYSEIKKRYREYVENQPVIPYKIVKHRIPLTKK